MSIPSEILQGGWAELSSRLQGFVAISKGLKGSSHDPQQLQQLLQRAETLVADARTAVGVILHTRHLAAHLFDAKVGN